MAQKLEKSPIFLDKNTKNNSQNFLNFAIENNDDWSKHYANNGQKRGFIEVGELTDFWIHMGTKCNLNCPSCFEESSQTSNRIETLSYAEAKPIILEALALGAQKFCFTGGEPFIHTDFIKILGLALEHRPCLVLSNATSPIEKYLPELEAFKYKPNKLSIRVSIDCPDEFTHDASRGKGNFKRALKNCAAISNMGHLLSIARRKHDHEDEHDINLKYKNIFHQFSLPEHTSIVAFPNLKLSEQSSKNPEITEHCMTAYKSAQDRDNFMCCHCLMLTKKQGELCFYPCTLVNDDESYNLGNTLNKARKCKRIILRHPRCFACFAHGTSCNESA